MYKQVSRKNLPIKDQNLTQVKQLLSHKKLMLIIIDISLGLCLYNGGTHTVIITLI